ncbi:MAG: DUF4270 domain-containing protein [Prevotella sp.]|jgi:hypothetical protein|nr:DUF4270 domain-containing protein [Prevotella sp.]
MNIKSYMQGFVLAASVVLAVACDDNLNSIGVEIQPEDDGIAIYTDTLPVAAETILMSDVMPDGIYARTTSAVLGKYEDPLFGTIKSEYLFEFKGADGLIFGADDIDSLSIQTNPILVDSVQICVTFINSVGDSLAPMGVTAYELTSPLKRDFYTHVNPADYCDMNKPLGHRTYTIYDTDKYVSSSTGETFRTLVIDVDTLVGRRFVNKYLQAHRNSNINVFANTDSLRNFFQGIYMSSSFGSGSLINVSISSMDVYYTYTHPTGSEAGTDTTLHSIFRLLVTPEVIQLNSIQNTYPAVNPLLDDPDAVYLKTPAGVCTQLKLPLHEIVRKIGAAETGRLSVNSGKLSLKGYSEKEATFAYDFGRPTAVLLIEKDSVADFFLNPQKRRPDGKTSFYASWISTTNSYDFTGLSSLITAYREKIEAGQLADDPYFILIPVEADLVSTTSGYSIRQVYNYMKPSTAAIRRHPKDLKFSYLYSVY